MELIPPDVAHKTSFIEAVTEYQSDDMPRVRDYQSLSLDELETDFAGYVAREKSKARGENLPEGWVPATTYWLVDKGEYIGRVSIRHRLTEALSQIGGHIGYDIRPSMRRRGYGTKVLELALPRAGELGLTDVLLTCDAANTGSRNIIERNGGVLRDSSFDSEAGIERLRYWIR